MKYKHLIQSGIAFGGTIALILSTNLSGSAQMGSPSMSNTAPTPSNSSNSSSVNSLSTLDREFMKMAAQSDRFEVRTSQLALTKASSPQVKSYAQKMIQEHTESTRKLTQIASQKGLSLPSSPNPFQQAVIERLTPLTGSQFDRAYMAAQTNGHMMAVAVFQTQADGGKDPQARSFASDLLPTIVGHYQMASQMSGQRNVLNNMPSNTMRGMNPVQDR